MDAGARSSTAWSFGVGSALILGIWLGSRGFRDFDPALVWYASASVFSSMGITYRYCLWLQRPPTRLYWRRGWSFFLSPRSLMRNVLSLPKMWVDTFLFQRFIERRSPMRWGAHWLISWGCFLAAAVTFPLSFGWIRFQTSRTSQETYIAYLFRLRLFSFQLESPVAFLTFNILNIAAVMVIVGLALALCRRATDRGALSVQQFANDLLPLILLFSVSVTGLMLTASQNWLSGFHYQFISQVHAITVITTLFYLPFGKFFHLFQRPAQLGVQFYKQVGTEGEAAKCIRCGNEFDSVLHISDLKHVETELGIRYRLGDGRHYQDVCPACRRKNLALLQDGMWREARRLHVSEEYNNG